jgi:hypothetical protein
MRNQLRNRVNHPDGKDNRQLTKQYYQKIGKDLVEGCNQCYDKLGKLPTA